MVALDDVLPGGLLEAARAEVEVMRQQGRYRQGRWWWAVGGYPLGGSSLPDVRLRLSHSLIADMGRCSQPGVSESPLMVVVTPWSWFGRFQGNANEDTSVRDDTVCWVQSNHQQGGGGSDGSIASWAHRQGQGQGGPLSPLLGPALQECLSLLRGLGSVLQDTQEYQGKRLLVQTQAQVCGPCQSREQVRRRRKRRHSASG